MLAIVAVVAAYLLGSIPMGYLVARFGYRIDIRTVGSGNIGATNIQRTLGWRAAGLVLLGDAGKGILAVALAHWLGQSELILLLAGVAAVIGHNWPLFLGFKGGRGIATSLGVLIMLVPQVVLVLLGVWLVVLLLTRYMSLASVSAAIALPLLVWFFDFPRLYFGVSLVLTVFAIYRHIPNIKRLLAGNEYRFGQRIKQEQGTKDDEEH